MKHSYWLVVVGVLGGACSDASEAPKRPDAGAQLAADSGEPAPPVCPAPEGSTELDELTLEVPASVPPGAPFMLSVRSVPPVDGRVQVCSDGEKLGEVQLYRGRGSMTTTLPEERMVTLQLAAAGARLERTLSVEARPKHELSGTLDAEDHVWSSDQDHVLSGRVVVPAGGTLRIEAGARVLFEELAALEVRGELNVLGSAEEPVLFTRAGESAWGELRLPKGARAQLEHAWFTAGGADISHKLGHSMSAPVISTEDATLALRGGGLVDNPGKAFGATRSVVTLEDVLVTRCDTGGEFIDTRLQVRRGHVLEMPDGDGMFDDDDNDGIYLLGEGRDEDGKVVESLIEDSVFARGEDDGIDHNTSRVRLSRVWVEGFRHECVAGSSGSKLYVVDSVLRGCEQGVEAGYGTPRVVVEHSLITGNQVGLRYGDTYDKTSNGVLEVTDSIITGNVVATKNYVGSLDGPRADKIHVRCSIIDDDDFSQQDDNRRPVDADWQARTCAEEPAAASCDASGPGTVSCF
jgi:hypothetical protein